MPLPPYRLSVSQLFLAVAASAVALALLRANIALGTVTACISALAVARTAREARLYRAAGGEVTPRRWARFATGSLVVSVAIIGSACFTFLFVYMHAELLRRGGMAHPPPAELNRGGALVGLLSGLLVGFLVRRRLWGPRHRWNRAD